MPGPTAVGQSRSLAARGVLAVFLVAVLVAAVALAAFVLRPDPNSASTVSGQVATREATLRMVPASGTTGASTCTDPSAEQVWRVTWRATAATAAPGPAGTDLGTELAERAAAILLVPTGFAVRSSAEPSPTTPAASTGPAPTSAVIDATSRPTPAGGWQSRDADRWLLRWSPTVAETFTAAKNEEWVRMGPLAALAAVPRSVRQDPWFVTPDGACSVYLAPLVSGTAAAGNRNTVAVIGDSLVAQLYGSENSTATGSGWLINRLVKAGQRAEIAAQGGRRWTIMPDLGSGLETADASMMDEIRGLREARSVVIALGVNDAGWVARAPNQEQYEVRSAWVILHLAKILDELRDHGHCTVLVTMATRNKTYLDSAPGSFDTAATRINDYLRERSAAGSDPNDRIRLWDWGPQADQHGTTDPQPWFGSDTIHLDEAGYGPYANALTSAAALC